MVLSLETRVDETGLKNYSVEGVSLLSESLFNHAVQLEEPGVQLLLHIHSTKSF